MEAYMTTIIPKKTYDLSQGWEMAIIGEGDKRCAFIRNLNNGRSIALSAQSLDWLAEAFKSEEA